MQIYVRQDGEYSKCGISSNVDKRSKAYDTHAPNNKLIFTATVSDDEARTIEGMVKKQFADMERGTGNEWFKVPVNIMLGYVRSLLPTPNILRAAMDHRSGSYELFSNVDDNGKRQPERLREMGDTLGLGLYSDDVPDDGDLIEDYPSILPPEPDWDCTDVIESLRNGVYPFEFDWTRNHCSRIIWNLFNNGQIRRGNPIRNPLDHCRKFYDKVGDFYICNAMVTAPYSSLKLSDGYHHMSNDDRDRLKSVLIDINKRINQFGWAVYDHTGSHQWYNSKAISLVWVRLKPLKEDFIGSVAHFLITNKKQIEIEMSTLGLWDGLVRDLTDTLTGLPHIVTFEQFSKLPYADRLLDDVNNFTGINYIFNRYNGL